MMILPVLAEVTQYRTHKVERGETLYGLGRKYGVTVNEIKRLNDLTSNNLRIGQVLKIKPLQAVTRPPVIEPPPTTPPVPERQPVQLPDSYYYTVKPQDNLYRISVNHNIKLKDMLEWNGFADETHTIQPGDRIIVKDPSKFDPNDPENLPQQSPDITTQTSPQTTEREEIVERVHVVQPRETLYRIATDNGMTVEEIKRLNNLRSDDIRVGQKLHLTPRRDVSRGTPPTSGAMEPDPEGRGRIRTDLIMPVDGLVTSEFGIRHGRPHKGIDIAAKTGTPIYAVLDGTVVFVGYQGAYGNVIVLEHPEFVMTVYAHNERNLVSVGDQVTKGQMIATVGATGDASGAHLHFEYRIKGRAINPRNVLPFDQR